MVARRQTLGRPKPVTGQRLHAILADDQERSGLGAGMDEEGVEGRVAERLELEMTRQDVAERPHRRLDTVTPSEGADESIEGGSTLADLVLRVDRQRTGRGVAPGPVMGEHGIRHAGLDGPHAIRQEA